jgi:hypothetical protein
MTAAIITAISSTIPTAVITSRARTPCDDRICAITAPKVAVAAAVE